MSDNQPPEIPDVLGEPWVQRTIPVREDRAAPGADRAVLVYQRDSASRDDGRPFAQAVLYLPGYVDYFFQSEHAQAFIDAGVEFYGLDQRGQGRSVTGGNYEDVRDHRVRNVEIARTVRFLRARGHTHITLLGHSTGGLQAVIYAARATPGGPWATTPPAPAVDAVLLNSPWLDLNRPEPLKSIGTLVSRAVGRIAPNLPLSVLGAEYVQALHSDYDGEFWFDPRYKHLDEFTVRAGFLRSIRRLHAEVARGLGITVPILLCRSDASGSPTKPTPEELANTDVVLNPDDMKRLAPRLGTDVTERVFPGALHDIALSSREIRDAYTAAAVEWVTTLPHAVVARPRERTTTE